MLIKNEFNYYFIILVAENALNTLKPQHITLVKAMKNPPVMVKTVMAAVCVMVGALPDKSPDPNKIGQYVIFLIFIQ